MSEILIRGQEPEDIPDLTDAWNQPGAIWGTLQAPFASVDARRKRSAALPASHTMLVAVVDGKVIGGGGAAPDGEPATRSRGLYRDGRP
jgi:hypothetical protein